MRKYAMGIDIGTTSVKAVLISSEGVLVDESTRAHDLISLHANWAEEDAGIWWRNTVEAVGELSARNKDKMPGLSCIGCSGMVPAIVLLDADGNPIRNTIQQNDARAIRQIKTVADALDQKELFARTGGTTNQQHILPRLLWVRENEPENWAKVKTILGSYDYIVYKLTGVPSIELNWAAESGSFDIRTREWLSEDLSRFGVSPDMLPTVHPSMEVVAETSAELEALMGLPPGIPVIAGSADHVASTLAAGIVEPGDLLIKFGGAGDILFSSGEIQTSRELFFDYHVVPGQSLINGCMAASGSLVKWYVKDILQSDSPTIFQELDQQAEQVPPASDGLVILPYFLGEKTPLFDPTARGVLFGLTLSHSRAHIFRAVLEAVIYGFRHHIEALEAMGCKPARIFATNGGAKSKFWCQIAADVLGDEICSYPSHPGSALGVAFLAGKSAGLFQEWQDIRLFLTDSRRYVPSERNVQIYNRAYRIYRELYQQLRGQFDEVQHLYDA